MNHKELKQILKESGISQTEVAKHLGISKTLMSFYVNGVRQIPTKIETEIILMTAKYPQI